MRNYKITFSLFQEQQQENENAENGGTHEQQFEMSADAERQQVNSDNQQTQQQQQNGGVEISEKQAELTRRFSNNGMNYEVASALADLVEHCMLFCVLILSFINYYLSPAMVTADDIDERAEEMFRTSLKSEFALYIIEQLKGANLMGVHQKVIL
jgi:hypothetical protein